MASRNFSLLEERPRAPGGYDELRVVELNRVWRQCRGKAEVKWALGAPRCGHIWSVPLLTDGISPGLRVCGRQSRFWEGRQQGTVPQVALTPRQPSLAVMSRLWPFGIPEAQSSHSLPPTPEKPAPPCPRAQPGRGCRWWDRSGVGWALGLGTVA